ncbi:MAG: electron transport complex subunit RsxB [Burkholderiaceae bacterium]
MSPSTESDQSSLTSLSAAPASKPPASVAAGPPQPAAHQIAKGAHSMTTDQKSLSDRLDDVLPQTQCTRCGFPSCRDYADALATNATKLNRCPPGGKAGIVALAKVLDTQTLPLDSSCGIEGPRLLAWIDPSACIGCTKCIIACPADAIIGGPKGMHTVLPSLCTGCELCLPPCPVDCIELTPLTQASPWSRSDANAARQRFEDRNSRRERELGDDHRRFGQKAQGKLAQLDQQAKASGSASKTISSDSTSAPTDRKRAIIEAAVERARLRQIARESAGKSQ